MIQYSTLPALSYPTHWLLILFLTFWLSDLPFSCVLLHTPYTLRTLSICLVCFLTPSDDVNCITQIADLGGLRLALRALMAQPNYDPNELVGGFTPVQRFFLGWANCWRQNITQERALSLLTLDPHGPNPMRCNGPLSNMTEFHEAFGVSAESPMYKEKEVRVDIW